MIIRLSAGNETKWVNFDHVKGFQADETYGSWIIFADNSPPLHVEERPEQIAASLFQRPQPMERQLWAA